MGTFSNHSYINELFSRIKNVMISKRMAGRGGSYAIFLGSVCHIFYRNPLVLTDFYAIRTPIVWHICGGIYFLQIWGGGGGQNCFQHLGLLDKASYRSKKKVGRKRGPPPFVWHSEHQLGYT